MTGRSPEARARLIERLTRAFADAGLPTPALDARMLAEAALRDAAPEEAATRFAARRLAGEPVSRIVGTRGFWTLDLAIGPATLDPRPDTETLVEAALAACPGRVARVLDLGTGSGALLLALLSEWPGAWGVGIDRAPAALSIAAANARAHALGDRARFVASDWAAALSADARFELIVSNPPYVRTGDVGTLAREVRDHDPLLALDGGADGLDAYRALMPPLRSHLAPGGVAVLELGEGQSEDVARLAEGLGLRVEACRRDLAGIERAIVLRRGE